MKKILLFADFVIKAVKMKETMQNNVEPAKHDPISYPWFDSGVVHTSNRATRAALDLVI